MNEGFLKKTIAENITYYRKQMKLTQAELSERINYSDKSISKWERGDGVPDVLVLAELAELFGVTINDLVYAGVKKNVTERKVRVRAFITLLSAGLPWLVAAVMVFLIRMVRVDCEFANHFFVYAIAVSGIVATVFTSMWFHHLWQLLSVSTIIWGVSLSFHVSFSHPQSGYIFIIATIMQVLTLLWYGMKYFSSRSSD